MFCIVKRENHPDRGLDEIIGPFDTEAAADAEVAVQLAHDDKWYKTYRPYDYIVWSLTAPGV